MRQIKKNNMENYRELIDISLPLDATTTIYPGNPSVVRIEHRGAASTHSEITIGSHTGTHVDTPMHVFHERDGLEEFALTQFVGKALVIDVTMAVEKITLEDMAHVMVVPGMRILFKTANSARGFSEFHSDYIYLDGDCAVYLAEQGVALVGIDAFSIKKRGGTDTRPHTVLLEKNIVILEGIDLSMVEAGEYTILCLPLKFSNIDGSPVRAVLMR